MSYKTLYVTRRQVTGGFPGPALFSGADGEPSRKRINARNWYNSPLASTANRLPRRSSSASVCLMMIGVRRTPIHQRFIATAGFSASRLRRNEGRREGCLERLRQKAAQPATQPTSGASKFVLENVQSAGASAARRL